MMLHRKLDKRVTTENRSNSEARFGAQEVVLCELARPQTNSTA